jgi:hypothetical protein
MDDELAAVTVPSGLKAGRSEGIFSILHWPGVSSVSRTTSPFFPLLVTGAISALKLPIATARCARVTDSRAKASCCWRVKPYFSAVASANTPMALPS